MARDLHFSLLKSTQTGFGSYLYCPVCAGVFFLMVKTGGARSWPLTFTYCWDTQSHFYQFLPVGQSEQRQYKGWTLSVDGSNCDSICHMPGIFQDTGGSWHHKAHLCILLTDSIFRKFGNILWMIRSSSIESDFSMLPVPPNKAPVAIKTWWLHFRSRTQCLSELYVNENCLHNLCCYYMSQETLLLLSNAFSFLEGCVSCKVGQEQQSAFE